MTICLLGDKHNHQNDMATLDTYVLLILMLDLKNVTCIFLVLKVALLSVLCKKYHLVLSSSFGDMQMQHNKNV